MGFYEELSKYYDIVFPLGVKQMEFINKRINPSGSILDIAAGTGNYSLALAKGGYDVTAVDLDDEMVNSIIEKANIMDIDLKAIKMNMLDMDTLDGKYDGIICIGNSLVHLKDKEEIHKALKSMKSALKDGGTLILQIVNYDRIIINDVKNLPTIDRPESGVKFIRDYDHVNGVIHFNTTLIVGDEEYKNSIPLYPLKSEDMMDILKDCGFEEIEFYGGFNEAPYERSNSFPLVVSAK